MESHWRDLWIGTIRMTIVALLTTGFVVLGLWLAFSGAGEEERRLNREIAQLQAQARDANLAIACVLALPVDPVEGRNANDVRFCFTQYDLEPPLLHANGGS
jgi:hypothetical protein